MHLVLGAEPFDAAQEDARLDLMGAIEIEQLVGEQLAVGAVALAEVGGELQAVLVHSDTPSLWPTVTEPRPSRRLIALFASARISSPSSRSRCVSNIHVENVV